MTFARLRLLGGVELKTRSGSAVPIPRKKAPALLAYLACHPDQAQPRDKLGEMDMHSWVDKTEVERGRDRMSC